MNGYAAATSRAIHAIAPQKALLPAMTSIFLLPWSQGVDGALVGFASLVPGLIHDLLNAVKKGDLYAAMKIQGLIDPLKDAVYRAGEPTGEAHGRMKAAMQAAGVLRNAAVQPPTHEPSEEEIAKFERRSKLPV